jgi:hypothetical protein
MTLLGLSRSGAISGAEVLAADRAKRDEAVGMINVGTQQSPKTFGGCGFQIDASSTDHQEHLDSGRFQEVAGSQG